MKYLLVLALTVLLCAFSCSKSQKKSVPAVSSDQSNNSLSIKIQNTESLDNGFPKVWVKLTNSSKHKIKLIEHPNLVTYHVGDYSNNGPIGSFSGNAIELEANSSIVHPPSNAGIWFKGDTLELINHLPKGKYKLWVSIRIDGKELKSDNVDYTSS